MKKAGSRLSKESKGIFYWHTKLCTASTSLVHTGNMLVYICILCMRFVAPWIKFGQVMEYNKRNIYLHKSLRKWGR